jgi:hypothetical protein
VPIIKGEIPCFLLIVRDIIEFNQSLVLQNIDDQLITTSY